MLTDMISIITRVYDIRIFKYSMALEAGYDAIYEFVDPLESLQPRTVVFVVVFHVLFGLAGELLDPARA